MDACNAPFFFIYFLSSAVGLVKSFLVGGFCFVSSLSRLDLYRDW